MHNDTSQHHIRRGASHPYLKSLKLWFIFTGLSRQPVKIRNVRPQRRGTKRRYCPPVSKNKYCAHRATFAAGRGGGGGNTGLSSAAKLWLCKDTHIATVRWLFHLGPLLWLSNCKYCSKAKETQHADILMSPKLWRTLRGNELSLNLSAKHQREANKNIVSGSKQQRAEIELRALFLKEN